VIVDSSALITILRDSPDADRYVDALVSANRPRLSSSR
jgi:uncharacterized protein with PIN domain